MQRRDLIVVAHPDDELLYFAPLLSGSSLLVVTDGNHEGKGRQRCDVVARVAKDFAVSSLHFGRVKDSPSDLSNEDKHYVEERVTTLVRQLRPTRILTHGPKGEYGHKQHVGVGEAVRESAKLLKIPTLYPAYDESPHEVHLLPQKALELVHLYLAHDYDLKTGHLRSLSCWGFRRGSAP